MEENRRQKSSIRCRVRGRRIFFIVQPHESIGVAARFGPLHFLYAELSGAPGSERGARGERPSRLCTRNFESATAYEPGKVGIAVPKGAGDQSRFAGLGAAEAIGYPVVIKPNIGGSGAGIEKFSSTEALRGAVDENRLYFGIDSAALVQEAFTPRDGVITRVEVLGGKYLYAIKIHTTGESFNLCPADICQSTKGEELTRIACPADAP